MRRRSLGRRALWLAALALATGGSDVQPAAAEGIASGIRRAGLEMGRRRGDRCKPPREPRRPAVCLGCDSAPVEATLQAALEGPLSSWTRNVGDPTHSALFVQNTGAPAQVEWVSFNGRSIFASLGEIQSEIDAIPPEADGSEPTRVFRFVTENRRHGFALTSSLDWFLSPTLFFNSSGVALCGEAAEEVNMLSTARGFSGREWGLTGHVIAEVLVGSRWHMYDADYGVYFLRRDGLIASVADLAADGTLITDPVLRLETPGPWSPYTVGYASLFTTAGNNFVRRTTPRPTRPPRPLLVMLPRGASLRFPGHFAPAPLDWQGNPIDDADYANLILRLPAGTAGVVANPFIVRAVRGSGSVALAGESYEIGTPELQSAIDARTDPLEEIELIETRSAVDVIYMLNPLRWALGTSNTLVLRTSTGASLTVKVNASGDAAGNSDFDAVPDDGDGSGIVGDEPCDHAATSGCDDNCITHTNSRQLDADRDGTGNACDGDFDQDELVTAADAAVLQACIAGQAPAADPSCAESDLTEDGRVDAADRSALDRLRGIPPAGGGGGCGMGPELAPALALLAWLRRRGARARLSRPD